MARASCCCCAAEAASISYNSFGFKTTGWSTTVLHQLQIHVIELFWCLVVGHVWNPLQYIRMVCLVWEYIWYTVTLLMISEVDPMENCESLFSGKNNNTWSAIGGFSFESQQTLQAQTLALLNPHSHLLCHPIDSTEVGVQHPAHHLQKPDLFSQWPTAW